MALVTGAQGVYATVAGVIDATAKAEIAVMLQTFHDLIRPDAGIQPSSPDFFHIEKHIADKLNDELGAMAAAMVVTAPS